MSEVDKLRARVLDILRRIRESKTPEEVNALNQELSEVNARLVQIQRLIDAFATSHLLKPDSLAYSFLSEAVLKFLEG